MWRKISVAVSVAAMVAATLAYPARAGEWQYDPATDLIFYNSVPVASWYGQPPLAGTGRGNYYRHHPGDVPGYPERLSGYPIPIYKAPRRMPPLDVRVAPGSHVEWCARRYRSYDVRTDTYQPYHGPRRFCSSPYR